MTDPKPHIQVNKITGKFRVVCGFWMSREFRKYTSARRELDRIEQDRFVRQGWEDV